ncbi:MAG TPA: type II secretion system F family protein [Candidatus Limnocylindrales bacterium]|nr:type II secretion system F family protein [Candidatus Limnocylindrales bacterium]
MTALHVLCGLSVGVGVWLVFAGSRRIERPEPLLRLRSILVGTARWRLVAVAVAVLATAVVTRWPVAALLAGLFTWAAPALLGGNRGEQTAQAKLEAIASWTETLRGRLRAYAGIEQAIRESADMARPPLHAHTTAMSTALTAGVRLPQALSAFQHDVDHHAADLVATSLRIAAAKHSGKLAAQLGWLADAVRQRVAARQRIETSRAESQSSARIVIIIVVVVGAGLFVFNRPLLSAYDSAGGQVVLLLVAGIWTLATFYLQQLTRLPEQERVLRDEAEPDHSHASGP